MKRTYLFFSLLLLSGSYSIAQNNVGIGTATPAASAALEISSNDKGILIPRMSSAQRNAIVSPAQGLMVYDTDAKSFYFFNGIAWLNISSSSFTLPYSADINTSISGFKINNSGTGAAIEGSSNAPYGIALTAKNTGEGGWGLYSYSSRPGSIAINAYSDTGSVFNGEILQAVSTDNLMKLLNRGERKIAHDQSN